VVIFGDLAQLFFDFGEAMTRAIPASGPVNALLDPLRREVEHQLSIAVDENGYTELLTERCDRVAEDVVRYCSVLETQDPVLVTFYVARWQEVRRRMRRFRERLDAEVERCAGRFIGQDWASGQDHMVSVMIGPDGRVLDVRPVGG
jgi:hypothetical protein